MEIYRTLEEIEDRPAVVLAIGSFDGLHKGHQTIIETVRKESLQRGVKSMVLTFSPTPREVLSDEKEIALMRPDEKIAQIRSMDIDMVCLIRFDREFAAIGRDDFIKRLLTYLDLKALVAGPDHHIGSHHEGGIGYLRETGSAAGFDLIVVPKARFRDQIISSQNIRKKLKEGMIDEVNAMLGHSYHLSGTVVRGEQRGRSLGFPTLNIKPHQSSCMLPAKGVYCVRLHLKGETFQAICNIGMRPTFGTDVLAVEVHVMDRVLDHLYDESADISFEHFIRKEKKFGTSTALIEQIKEDIEKCKKILTEEKCQV
jgi:riboflavin kinase / FMN adenylyltransferase